MPSWSRASMAATAGGPAPRSRDQGLEDLVGPHARREPAPRRPGGRGWPGPTGRSSSAEAAAARRASDGSVRRVGVGAERDLVVAQHQARLDRAVAAPRAPRGSGQPRLDPPPAVVAGPRHGPGRLGDLGHQGVGVATRAPRRPRPGPGAADVLACLPVERCSSTRTARRASPAPPAAGRRRSASTGLTRAATCNAEEIAQATPRLLQVRLEQEGHVAVGLVAIAHGLVDRRATIETLGLPQVSDPTKDLSASAASPATRRASSRPRATLMSPSGG